MGQIRQQIEDALYRNLPREEVDLSKEMLVQYLELSTDESSIRAIISGLVDTNAENVGRCIQQIVAIHRRPAALPLTFDEITELNEQSIRLETIRA